MNHYIRQLLLYLKSRFELSEDNAPQQEVAESIRKGVEFKGTNLWILVFAIFVACLGLNVNSTAVIIGAMLISPLMAPIIGVGLSLGTNDFDLLKHSTRNFFLMVGVSLVSATIFFLLFQPGYNQSELLARTTPTANDVFIALFGGLAGMVAQTRKDKTPTVISGVAIATALMPPLCTAGFGIATGQWTFFLGAFYLFTINATFISIASYLMTIFLKYEKKVFIDPEREKKVKSIMAIIVVVVTIPSILIGVKIMNRSRFENNANKFVHQVFQSDSYALVDHSTDYHYKDNMSKIQIHLIGDNITDAVIDMAQAQMENYGLKNTELVVRQTDFGGNRTDFSKLQKGYSDIIKEKDKRITRLENRLRSIKIADTIEVAAISRELGAIADHVQSLSVQKHIRYSTMGVAQDTAYICLIRGSQTEEPIDTARIKRWLAERLRNPNIEIFTE